MTTPAIALLDREDRAYEGSDEIVKWCPVCLENTVPLRDGSCGFCDTQLDGDVPTPAEPVVPRRRERRHNHGTAYTDEQIVARIQLWAQITGRPPSKRDWSPNQLRRQALKTRKQIDRLTRRLALYELGDFPAETTVRDRFGSLNAALVMAGYEPRATGREPKERTVEAPKPKTGPKALAEYMAAVEEARQADDPVSLKQALWTLALSAISEADRLDVVLGVSGND